MWNLITSHAAVCVEPGGGVRTGPKPPALLPGSFNPLHRGHTALAAAAAAHLGVPVHFELSVANADKPELPREEVERRVKQFAGVAPVWVTRAATFPEKADVFPGAAFVLGWDTAVRVIDPKYYGGEAGRDAALRKLLDRGCRLVVGGRADAGGAFRVWDGGGLALEFAPLFVPLAEADFRADVSSTALRGK
jgi:Cytidylyltransferase-like